MKVWELVKIGTAELRAQKKALVFAVLAASVLFTVMLAVSLALNGLENGLIRKAREVTNGELFVTSVISGEKVRTVVERTIREAGGEVVSVIEGGNLLGEGDLERTLVQRSGVKLMSEPPYGKSLVELEMDYGKGVKLVDLILSGADKYYGPNKLLVRPGQMVVLAKFARPEQAYEYMKVVECKNEGCAVPRVAESFSNQVGIWVGFRKIEEKVGLVKWVLLVVAGVIAMLSCVKFLDQEKQKLALYRVLGATTGEMMGIMMVMVLEIGALVAVVSVALASVLAGVVSLLNMGYLTEVIEGYYGTKTGGMMLWGWGKVEMEAIAVILVSVMMSLVLMSDQLMTVKLVEHMGKNEDLGL